MYIEYVMQKNNLGNNHANQNYIWRPPVRSSDSTYIYIYNCAVWRPGGIYGIKLDCIGSARTSKVPISEEDAHSRDGLLSFI